MFPFFSIVSSRAFGRGDHYYLGGPWPKGTPEQGYQADSVPLNSIARQWSPSTAM